MSVNFQLGAATYNNAEGLQLLLATGAEIETKVFMYLSLSTGIALQRQCLLAFCIIPFNTLSIDGCLIRLNMRLRPHATRVHTECWNTVC